MDLTGGPVSVVVGQHLRITPHPLMLLPGQGLGMLKSETDMERQASCLMPSSEVHKCSAEKLARLGEKEALEQPAPAMPDSVKAAFSA